MFDRWLRLPSRVEVAVTNSVYICKRLDAIDKELAGIKLAISKLEASKPYPDISQPSTKELISQCNIVPADKVDPAENAILIQQINELADDIRNMDHLIFKMSQCTNWIQMQPFYLELAEGMEARKRNESNRINNILRKELIKTYAPKLEDILGGNK